MQKFNSILKTVLLSALMIFGFKGFSQKEIGVLQSLNELPKLESGIHN